MALVKSETHHSSRFASLYVGDLSPDVTEKDLIDKFSVIGPVVSVHLCRDSITGESLSYAFVNFDSSFSASNAMGCFNNTVLKGKAMRIMLSQTDLSNRPRAEENGQSSDFYCIRTSCGSDEARTEDFTRSQRGRQRILSQDVPQIDHDQKKHLRRKNSSTHRCLSLVGEVCLMQENLKQEILTKVQFLTFDDEGVLVGL
ncbi:PREDICTED: polyadenylate-binding protein 6-like [Camelina sativa]|uniref:Polyadenylate-binding protein 6-like n=1 Tax=Camelina sativa TaxID=90675 RepID=A0ABM0TDM1_CAMSA|nr:PREDICTED: polyadenylate-binding protein 6-like [Camelina sativa]